MNASRANSFLRNEIIILCKSLHTQHNEDWMASLQALETKYDVSNLETLQILKSLLPSIVTTCALKNLVQIFVRKTSCIMEKHNIAKGGDLAVELLKIVKDFWVLFCNQHVFITQQAFGKYLPMLYEVLPSLTSLYIDLFTSVYSIKHSPEKACKRLCGWLLFQLNERCIKTALLETYECTKTTSRFLLPLLRKLLSKPPTVSSDLDYLLHFIFLKRWAFVCEELSEFIQANLSVEAPKGFPEWLTQHWPNAGEYLPTDKNLQGRRISELMLSLDEQAVEELIDVYSQCLSSQDVSSSAKKATGMEIRAKHTSHHELFVLDKEGNEKLLPEKSKRSSKKKRKIEQDIVIVASSGSSVHAEDMDNFVLPGFFGNSPSHEQSENSTKSLDVPGKVEEKENNRKRTEYGESLTRVKTNSTIAGFYECRTGTSEPKIQIIESLQSPEPMEIQPSTASKVTHTLADNESEEKAKTELQRNEPHLDYNSSGGIEEQSQFKSIVSKNEMTSLRAPLHSSSDENNKSELISKLDSSLLYSVALETEKRKKSSSRNTEIKTERGLTLKDNAETSFSVCTRLRAKSKRPVNSFEHDLRKRKQNISHVQEDTAVFKMDDLKTHILLPHKKITRSKAKIVENQTEDEAQISAQLPKSPEKALKRSRKISSKNWMPNNDNSATQLPNSETPSLKNMTHLTLSGRDSIKRKITGSQAQDTPSASSPPDASAGTKQLQPRYFLRTNCSHRLLSAGTFCPTCSSENITSPKMTKN